MPEPIIGGTFRSTDLRRRVLNVQSASQKKEYTPIGWPLNSIASVGLHLNHLFSAIWSDTSTELSMCFAIKRGVELHLNV